MGDFTKCSCNNEKIFETISDVDDDFVYPDF